MAEEEETPQTNNAYDQAISFIVNLFDPGFTTEISGLSTRLKESCENLVINEYIISAVSSDLQFKVPPKLVKNKKNTRDFIQTLINNLITQINKKKYDINDSIINLFTNISYTLIGNINNICEHMGMYRDTISGGENKSGTAALQNANEEWRKKEERNLQEKAFKERNAAIAKDKKDLETKTAENLKKYKKIITIKNQIDTTFKSNNTNKCILEWVNEMLSSGFTTKSEILYEDLNQFTDLLQLPIYNLIMDIFYYNGNDINAQKSIMLKKFKEDNKGIITDFKMYDILIKNNVINVETDAELAVKVSERSMIQMDFIYMYFQYSLFFHIIKLFTENMPTDANAAKKFIKELYINVINKIQSKLNPDFFNIAKIPDVVRTGGRRRHLKTRRRTRFRKAKKLKSKTKTKTKTKSKKRRHTKKNKYL